MYELFNLMILKLIYALQYIPESIAVAFSSLLLIVVLG